MLIIDRSSLKKGIFYMLLSSLFVPFLNLSAKIGLYQISPWCIAFLRQFLPFLLVLGFLFVKKQAKNVWKTSQWRVHIYRSIAVAISQLSLVYYLTRASLLDATLLWCIGPFFVPLIFRLLYKTQIHSIVWISLVLSFCGTLLIIKPSQEVFDPFSLWGVLSGVAMAFSQVFLGSSAEKGDLLETLFFLYFLASLWTSIPYLFSFLWLSKHVAVVSPGSLTTALGGLTVCSLGNQIFRSLAYKSAKPYLIAVLLYLSVLLSALLDWVVFDQVLDAWAIGGFILFFLGVILKWRWVSKQERVSLSKEE